MFLFFHLPVLVHTLNPSISPEASMHPHCSQAGIHITFDPPLQNYCHKLEELGPSSSPPVMVSHPEKGLLIPALFPIH